MTEVAFHFGAPDKLAYVCRLLRKAVGAGAKVVVLADAEVAMRLDAALWALSPTDFIGHCLGTAESAMKSQSAVVVVSDMAESWPQRQVLVNLAAGVPDGFEAFDRLIEVVSTDDSDRDLARRRWKYYTERGYHITRHDLALKGMS